jgi:hypothetical protein
MGISARSLVQLHQGLCLVSASASAILASKNEHSPRSVTKGARICILGGNFAILLPDAVDQPPPVLCYKAIAGFLAKALLKHLTLSAIDFSLKSVAVCSSSSL